MVSRNSPEQQRKSSDTCSNQHANPNRSSQQQLLDIRFSNGECSEGCRLGLAHEDEDRIKLVLMGDEEENGNGEWDEELDTTLGNRYNQ